MSSQENKFTDAFVLHTRPWRDTSLLVDVLSKEDGLLRLLARSARGHKSRFRGYLQVFTPLRMLYGGRGELLYLQKVELSGLSYVLQGSAYMAAYYLNELLLRLLKGNEPCPHIYSIYMQALHELKNPQQVEQALRMFEKRLLQALGYGLNCSFAADGQAIEPSASYAYQHELGFVQLPPADTAVGYSGAMLLALAAENPLSVQQLQQCKRLLRHVLSHYVGAKGLKSWSVWS